MELLTNAFDLFLHIDDHLNEIIKNYRMWTYLILFLIIFAETGLVVTPFLPGDPLLFAAGALIAAGGTGLDIYVLGAILTGAAILGNATNYTIGRALGQRVFKPTNRILKLEYYDSTNVFFEKHGGKAVIFSRFFPVLRTFVPFVAGVGKMKWSQFTFYNVVGAFVWIVFFLAAGFLFGNLAVVKENFSVVIIAITVLATIPPVVAGIRARISKSKVQPVPVVVKDQDTGKP
ncbi:MAG TPA: DedA family protein [Sphingobacteriaceae bacterium]